mgnify:FL=1|jgi:phosphoserine aminotransferase
MERVYNFSAGPSTLPEEVLKTAASELVNYQDAGMSVMEMSHRSAAYSKIIEEAKQDFIDLLSIPDNYEVLFLQGGASLQFAMIPLNIGTKNKKAQFINTGAWSKKAISEAKKFIDVEVLASSEDDTFSYIPDLSKIDIDPNSDYFYITSNNTIYGTEFTSLPDTKGVPVVADMSSNILSKPINVSEYGIIFAGAQKNMGPAGMTVVIIRKDLIGEVPETVPTMLKYSTHAENDSMFNTPPTYSIYVAGLVFKWLKENGGLEAIEKINTEKADLLYDYLDSTDFYVAPVDKASRSKMNVTFICKDDALNADFIKEAAAQGMVNLKGHRSVGGMRASIYNAMPVEGVQKLVDFMKAFEAKHS